MFGRAKLIIHFKWLKCYLWCFRKVLYGDNFLALIQFALIYSNAPENSENCSKLLKLHCIFSFQASYRLSFISRKTTCTVSLCHTRQKEKSPLAVIMSQSLYESLNFQTQLKVMEYLVSSNELLGWCFLLRLQKLWLLVIQHLGDEAWAGNLIQWDESTDGIPRV